MATTHPPALTLDDLDQFIGSETYYRHSLGQLIYTDGVKYLADTAGAHWLIDVVASHQHKPSVSCEPFQLWTLNVRPDKSAVVIMQADTPAPRIVTQQIEFSDFPFPFLQLYACDNGNGVTLMLKSEY